MTKQNAQQTLSGAQPTDFYYIAPQNSFLCEPTGQFWEAAAVQAKFKTKAKNDIIKQRTCDTMIWAPGEPLILSDKVLVEGGWMDKPGFRAYNTYKAPIPFPEGDPAKAEMWLELGRKQWGDEQLKHILNWMACRVQHPEVKINHAIVLGSFGQGIGKDSFLAPLRRAVGPWNWSNISARAAADAEDYNAFLSNVIVQISEAHDLGNARFGFYDKTKDWCASPPDTLRVADKYVKAHQVLNACGLIYTTNHKSDGLYIPPNDRRHYVGWSECKQSDFPDSYWNELWLDYYMNGGFDHVAAYLYTRDLSDFKPKAPPPKTEAWHAIVQSNADPLEGDLNEAIMRVADDWFLPHMPDAVTASIVAKQAQGDDELEDVLTSAKYRRKLVHKFDLAGYTVLRNPDSADGRWRITGTKRRELIFVRNSLSRAAQYAAVRELIKTAARDLGHRVEPGELEAGVLQ